MLIHLVLTLLSVESLNQDLEKNLDAQLKQCTNILNHARNFYQGLPNFGDNRRRLTDSKNDWVQLENDVEMSLDTCMAVVRAVSNFYKDLKDSDLDFQDGDSWKDPIILNVGGTPFSTSLATLRSEPGSFFEEMFRNGSNTTCSVDGTFFIDRNPKTFEYILDILRTGDVLIESQDTDLRLQLLEDAEFYKLPEELKAYLRYTAMSGIDLSLSEFSWLNEQLPGSYKLGGLLYDTLKDGDSVSTFHSRCDGEGATVTIIETTLGVMFGGFTQQSWSSSAGYVQDNDAFLFRLRPSKMKFTVSYSQYAIYRHSSYGPRFGATAILIDQSCRSNAKSYVSSGSYNNIGSNVLNNGQHDFRVKQYAVVQAAA